MSKVKANTIENVAGDKSVAVAGLSKIEDTGKNICTAWVSFDGATTPPTIRDSFNVSSIVRTATGQYEIYFEDMDNNNYSVSGAIGHNQVGLSPHTTNVGKAGISTYNHSSGSYANITNNFIQIFGGKA